MGVYEVKHVRRCEDTVTRVAVGVTKIIFTGAAIIAANAVTIAMHANAVVIAVNLGVSTSLLGSLIFHISSSERRIRWSKCGENRNHGKFKIYFLNILSDYRFKSCHFHVLHVGLHMKLYFS